MDRRVVLLLVGETFREIGILAVTFIPSEAAFSDHVIDPFALPGFVTARVLLIACGILLEAKNR